MGNFRTISWGFVQIKTNGEPDSWLRSGYCETQRETESIVRRAAWAQKELSGQEQRDPSQDTGYREAVAAQTKPLQEILMKKKPQQFQVWVLFCKPLAQALPAVPLLELAASLDLLTLGVLTPLSAFFRTDLSYPCGFTLDLG